MLIVCTSQSRGPCRFEVIRPRKRWSRSFRLIIAETVFPPSGWRVGTAVMMQAWKMSHPADKSSSGVKFYLAQWPTMTQQPATQRRVWFQIFDTGRFSSRRCAHFPLPWSLNLDCYDRVVVVVGRWGDYDYSVFSSLHLFHHLMALLTIIRAVLYEHRICITASNRSMHGRRFIHSFGCIGFWNNIVAKKCGQTAGLNDIKLNLFKSRASNKINFKCASFYRPPHYRPAACQPSMSHTPPVMGLSVSLLGFFFYSQCFIRFRHTLLFFNQENRENNRLIDKTSWGIIICGETHKVPTCHHNSKVVGFFFAIEWFNDKPAFLNENVLP